MVGVDVPAGKRLYASKDLKGSAFAGGDGRALATVTAGTSPPPCSHMLVITRPTYGECLAELQRIWQNWENEGRELPAGQTGRRAL